MCGEVIGGRGKGTGIFGLHTSAHPKMKALSRILGWSTPQLEEIETTTTTELTPTTTTEKTQAKTSEQ